MIGLGISVGLLVGLLLGLLGGGGSIVTVPALVYLLGQDVSGAAATSLVVVGANALVGVGSHHRAGRVLWRTVVAFGAGGLAGALPGALLNHLLPGTLVLFLLAVVMLAAAILMVRRRQARAAASSGECSGWNRCATAALVGIGVGFMTGLFGIGGGFLIVPALAGVLGLAMPQAIGTSLAVIALNSASGLFGHALSGRVELGLAPPLIAGGALGIVVGSRLAGRVPEAGLRRLFAALLVALAAFLVLQNSAAIWSLWVGSR